MITLSVSERATPKDGYELWDNFPGEVGLQAEVINALLRRNPTRSINIFHDVTPSKNVSESPHELDMTLKTSFTVSDFRNEDETPTTLWKRLHEVGGHLISDSTGEYLSSEALLQGQYWSPEWPNPCSVYVAGYEERQESYNLYVTCIADDNAQLIHLLLHPSLDELISQMLPQLEAFVNRWVADPSYSPPVQ